MSEKHESPGSALLRAWDRTGRLPLGHRVFTWLVGRMAPYTASMGAVVRDLEPGYARVTLRDHRRIRNHLASIHAVALANLGELATGLAVTTGLPPAVRGIAVRLSVAYAKKARGTITAECRTRPPGNPSAPVDHAAVAELRDREGHLVAEVTAVWRVAPA